MTNANSTIFNEKTPQFDSLLTAINALSSRSIDTLTEVDWQTVSGGDINEASLLTLSGSNQQLFLKQNTLDKAPVLEAELAGLIAICETGARTCQPLAIGSDVERERSFLLLSVIHSFTGSKASATEGWQDLALQLATLHKAVAPQPDNGNGSNGADSVNNFNNSQPSKWYAGWFDDNFIGSNPQYNSWTASWHEFFASQRLGAQCEMAFNNQLINRKTMQQIERLQHKLEQYIPNYPLTDAAGKPRPSLLHGDLWAGNAMLGNSDNNSKDKALGYLIDPAVYVGHPETDLAMTQMFGGFTSDFYEAYLEYGLVQDGFDERVDIYNLYHYLNHLNLLGSGYLSAVQRIAQRFGS